MTDDPVVWLANHILAGIDLREEGRALRTKKDAETWHNRELDWAQTLRDGIGRHSPRDVARVDRLDQIRPLMLPAGHPFGETAASGIAVSSTGVGQFGNNPLSCHAARIEIAREVEREWRAAKPTRLVEPKRPRGRPPGDVTLDERGKGWLDEIDAGKAREPKITYDKLAGPIAVRDGVAKGTVLRETQRARKARGN